MYNESKTASADIRGSSLYPGIHGSVDFKQTAEGVLVTADIYGLPCGKGCPFDVFAFHVHSGTSCSGNAADPFADADGHYNPQNRQHPYHAGDLPPLFSNDGHAFMTVLTERFKVEDVIGHTVIIHKDPDDFTTQPAGNSGAKIACGKII